MKYKIYLNEFVNEKLFGIKINEGIIIKDDDFKKIRINEENISSIDTLGNFFLKVIKVDSLRLNIIKENIEYFNDDFIIINNSQVNTPWYSMFTYINDEIGNGFNCDENYDYVTERIVEGFPHTWFIKKNNCIINLDYMYLTNCKIRQVNKNIYILTHNYQNEKIIFKIYKLNDKKIECILSYEDLSKKFNYVDDFEIYNNLIFLKLKLISLPQFFDPPLFNSNDFGIYVFDLNKRRSIKINYIIK